MFHKSAKTYQRIWDSFLGKEYRTWLMTLMPEDKIPREEHLLFVTRVCPKQGINLLNKAMTKFDSVHVVWLVTEDEWRSNPDRFCLGCTIYSGCPRYTLVLSHQNELYAICDCISEDGDPPCPITHEYRCINEGTIERLHKALSGIFNEHPEICRQRKSASRAAAAEKARRKAAAEEKIQRKATATGPAPRKRARKAGD